jgi:hypothetical protein
MPIKLVRPNARAALESRFQKLGSNATSYYSLIVCASYAFSFMNAPLCLLKRGVQVTTYDFGFMDDSITN